MLSFLLRTLFHERTDLPFTPSETEQFDRIYARALENDGNIDYRSDFPKHRFIDYLIRTKNFVAHGSNYESIDTFETRKQTLYNGRTVEAVFASKDGIWPIFYAVFDRSKLDGHFRNACLVSGQGKRYYLFSVTERTMERDPWTRGTVYLLPSEAFERSSRSKIYFDEWICRQPIRPKLRMSVSQEDFEYRNQVSVHRPGESIFKTWLLYKRRANSVSSRRG